MPRVQRRTTGLSARPIETRDPDKQERHLAETIKCLSMIVSINCLRASTIKPKTSPNCEGIHWLFSSLAMKPLKANVFTDHCRHPHSLVPDLICPGPVIQVCKYPEAFTPPVLEKRSLNLSEEIRTHRQTKWENRKLKKSTLATKEQGESKKLTMLRKNLYVVVTAFVTKLKKPVTFGKQVCSSPNVLILELM